MPLVCEKGVLVKPAKVELVDDGMIVRFAYHNPVKYFFDPILLYNFVMGNEKKMHDEGKNFHFSKLTRNQVKLTLLKPVSGHTEMILPRDVFVQTVREMFEP